MEPDGKEVPLDQRPAFISQIAAQAVHDDAGLCLDFVMVALGDLVNEAAEARQRAAVRTDSDPDALMSTAEATARVLVDLWNETNPHPGKRLVQINRMVSTKAAMKILMILAHDEIPDGT